MGALLSCPLPYQFYGGNHDRNPRGQRHRRHHPADPAGAVRMRNLTNRPIGRRQLSVLRCFVEHAPYWPGHGWTWNGVSETKRIMESLRKRGLVELVAKGRLYTITAKGKQEIA